MQAAAGPSTQPQQEQQTEDVEMEDAQEARVRILSFANDEVFRTSPRQESHLGTASEGGATSSTPNDHLLWLRCVLWRSSSRSFSYQPAEGYESDNLDEPEEAPVKTRKRKLTKAAEAKLKAKEKEKAKKKAKKNDDDDYEDEDEDPYSALSKMWKDDLPKPPVGSFENCVRCQKQFTVVRSYIVFLSIAGARAETSCRRSIPFLPIPLQAICVIHAPRHLAAIRSRSPPRRRSANLRVTNGPSPISTSVDFPV